MINTWFGDLPLRATIQRILIATSFQSMMSGGKEHSIVLTYLSSQKISDYHFKLVKYKDDNAATAATGTFPWDYAGKMMATLD